jgi:hypothetical protein
VGTADAAGRRIAVRLANEGRLVITRKGKPVDPNDFRGVYRFASACRAAMGPLKEPEFIKSSQWLDQFRAE